MYSFKNQLIINSLQGIKIINQKILFFELKMCLTY